MKNSNIRKSSESEDRQVASIESQLTILHRAFGNRTDIEIVQAHEEAISEKARIGLYRLFP